jgi:hypothetical protein
VEIGEAELPLLVEPVEDPVARIAGDEEHLRPPGQSREVEPVAVTAE